MSHRNISKTRRDRVQQWLSSKSFGRLLLLWFTEASRFWGLKVVPALKRMVLPGCGGMPIWDILKNFTDRDLWQSAKALSYSMLTAIPPLMVFLFSSIAYFPVDGVQDQLLTSMQNFVPPGIFDRMADAVNDIMGHRHATLLSIGFAASIVLAANGMYGMMQSFNFMDHESTERPLWLRYAIALVLVLLLYFLVVVVLALLVGYQLLVKWLISMNILADSTSSRFLFSFVRLVFLAFVTLLVISIVYYIAPTRKRRLDFFSAGSVIATLLFFGLSWGFQVYLRVFNNYNILYGSIGTLLVIMLYIYANCLVILVGYAINIAVANARGNLGFTLKTAKHHNNGTQHRKPYHRPALRTDRDGNRQAHGGPVWFGPAGSVRYTGAGGTDGKDRHNGD